MLAAVKTKQKREVVLQETERPRLKEGDVLIQVDCCGVCGSDLHAYNHSKGYEFVPKPIILGHEIAGTVIDVHDPSNEKLIGQKVIVESMHYCGECDNCRMGRTSICLHNQVIGLHFNGGMAEYVKTNVQFIQKIPDGLSPTTAALCEPMAIAVHAVERAGKINDKQVVLVQGPGIIGLFVSIICVLKGAKVILSGLERDFESRLSKCPLFGVEPHVVEHGPVPDKVDLLFECSGANSAVQLGFNRLKKGGKAIIVALYEEETSLFLTQLVRNEWSLITSYGCDPSDYQLAFELLKSHEESLQYVVDYYSLSNAVQAFTDSFNQTVLKSVLTMETKEG
ncbi:zinc-binding dehydrogenase [Pseudalkalibacillus sp. A8]|uniref:zinc-dependent alcohol dehydrogenase n=1 Tax=Pseudalkalibacillus sp. A8 TaxID=3382641 RepID=UPI0038B5B1E7